MATPFEPVSPTITILVVYPLLSATKALRLTNKIQAVVDTDTHESILDLNPLEAIATIQKATMTHEQDRTARPPVIKDERG
jgi:hypothetical protein